MRFNIYKQFNFCLSYSSWKEQMVICTMNSIHITSSDEMKYHTKDVINWENKFVIDNSINYLLNMGRTSLTVWTNMFKTKLHKSYVEFLDC